MAALSCQRAEQSSAATARNAIITSSGGAAYAAECASNGVPVPTLVLGPRWENHGEVEDEFLAPANWAQLWSWATDAGLCTALPRFDGPIADAGRKATAFGVICMNSTNGATCFFDNPKNVKFDAGVAVPLSSFWGGVDLKAGTVGACSDCHAGHNPWVIHPEKPAFKAFVDLRGDRQAVKDPARWYVPIVPAGWPENPGPDSRLLKVDAGTGLRCMLCHNGNRAFPELSTDLARFCYVAPAGPDGVLHEATTRPKVFFPREETMPTLDSKPMGVSYQDYRVQYQADIDALRAFCKRPPADGGAIDQSYSDDGGVLSPPIIQSPIFACAPPTTGSARAVSVYGAVPGATIELYQDGGLVGSQVAQIGSAVFWFGSDLTLGDTFHAVQRIGTTVSAPSDLVQAVPFVSLDGGPGLLPTPSILPMTACAVNIGVQVFVPGVEVTAWKNGASAEVRSTSTDALIMSPGATPWAQGDAFTARTKLCGVQSALSPPVAASAAPTRLRQPLLRTEKQYEHQEFITVQGQSFGAYNTISTSLVPDAGDTCSSPGDVSCWFSFPLSSVGRPLVLNETVSAVSRLHCPGGPTATFTGPPALPCSELPAPRIAEPEVGDRVVVVQEAVPGARIRIFDSSGNEVGDGSAPLVRLVPGYTVPLDDFITASQQIGPCRSTKAFKVRTRVPVEP